MVQFLSIIIFLGFLQFLLGFSKVPVFFVSLCIKRQAGGAAGKVGAAQCYRLTAKGRQDWHRNMEVKAKSVLQKHWMAG